MASFISFNGVHRFGVHETILAPINKQKELKIVHGRERDAQGSLF